MLRASSLGLHLSSSTIFVFKQCFQAYGPHRNQRVFYLVRRSSAFHLSVHPRQTKDEKLHTENSRVDIAVCPVVFSSSVSPSYSWATRQTKNCGVADLLPERDSDFGAKEEELYGQESAIEVNISSTSTSDDVITLALEEKEGEQTIVPPLKQYIQEAPFLSGRPWEWRKVKPLRSTPSSRHNQSVHIPSLEDELVDIERLHQDMLYVLATTNSAEDGWKAYTILSRLQYYYDTAGNVDHKDANVKVTPLAHLHRLVRVMAQNRPKTHLQFLRLLSLLTTIQNMGGKIQLHEWNTLIDHAGKGLRKTHARDFNNALGIYYDMVHNRQPGTGFSSSGSDDGLNTLSEDHIIDQHPSPASAVTPDIYTYTTLIDIAARTNLPPILHRATQLLKQAELSPNRITHLSLLKYFTAKKQLSGVRSTLVKMKEQKLELGVDGLNACMWAYGHNDRVDVVMMIYRLLRHNIVLEEYEGDSDVSSVARQLQVEESIVVQPDWKPNEVTFTLMIQTMAYHGNLMAALSVFVDMLSSPNLESGAPLVLDENNDLQPRKYPPTIHVYRAIFLGFARHGVGPKTGPKQGMTNVEDLKWNLESLRTIFENFLYLPPDTKLSVSTIFWIINAFSKTSGHDMELLRSVWKQMENRFGRFKGGPKHRLTRWRHKLFPEDG